MGALEERHKAAEAAAEAAEETAAVAMQRAGGAVRDEMEAAAVVKETQHALAKALQELRDLGPTEDQVAMEAARCRLSNVDPDVSLNTILKGPCPYSNKTLQERGLGLTEDQVALEAARCRHGTIIKHFDKRVTKETQHALTNVLQKLRDLGPTEDLVTMEAAR